MTEKRTVRLYGMKGRRWVFAERRYDDDATACIEMDVIDGRPVAVRLVPLDDDPEHASDVLGALDALHDIGEDEA